MAILRAETPSPGTCGQRSRIGRACDRCRLKKSKCDGLRACSRCKADNTICEFGKRKRRQDKAYPRGYVEVLEKQSAQLVIGLYELYRRLQMVNGRAGSSSLEESRGMPLVHDILEHLGTLDQDNEHEPGESGDLIVTQRNVSPGDRTGCTQKDTVESEANTDTPISAKLDDPITTLDSMLLSDSSLSWDNGIATRPISSFPPTPWLIDSVTFESSQSDTSNLWMTDDWRQDVYAAQAEMFQYPITTSINSCQMMNDWHGAYMQQLYQQYSNPFLS